MKRYSEGQAKYVDSKAIDAFLADIVEVYKRHGMSISHEDRHGAFVIQGDDYIDRNAKWLMNAHDGTGSV